MLSVRFAAAGLLGLAALTDTGAAVADPRPEAKLLVVAKVDAAQSDIALVPAAPPAQRGTQVATAAGAAGAAMALTEQSFAAVTKPDRKPKPATTLSISVDLGRQRMTVSEYGKVRHVFKVSTGRSGYLTPTGTWRPKWMTRMHYSRKYDNAPMPHSIFFHGGYAIHATSATGRLGSPASHGCVRLSPYNAKQVYRLVQAHSRAATLVKVHGVAPIRRAVAKTPTKRRSASNARHYGGGTSAGRSHKPYSHSYVKPSYGGYGYGWPGDAPRRRLSYGY